MNAVFANLSPALFGWLGGPETPLGASLPSAWHVLLATLFALPLLLGLGYSLHFLFALPLRRRERARFLLDLIGDGLNRGQSLAHTVAGAGGTGERSLGRRLRRAATLIDKGLDANTALAATAVLPAPVLAMLRAGTEAGDVRRVLPACRATLEDAVSRLWSAHHYLALSAFALSPAFAVLLGVVAILVLPRLVLIAQDLGGSPAALPPLLLFVSKAWRYAFLLQSLLALAFLGAALVYISGPRVVREMFPGLADVVALRIPWRRKRMQRDFSAVLAVLLDAGVPEPRAVLLASECTYNRLLQARAVRVVEGLRQGLRLSQALELWDDSGEFRWRLANAARGQGAFGTALDGWHEALEAKAFQQEQTAAQVLTTSLVFWNGLVVGLMATALFQLFTTLIEQAPLW